MLLALAELYALLLGEIDLSIGFVAGLGGVVMAAIGALQGTLITRLGLPSFVVTWPDCSAGKA